MVISIDNAISCAMFVSFLVCKTVLRVRYKAILDEPKGKHECFHLQFSKHLLTFFSYLKYVLTNLTFFCCEYSKESFCIFEKS